MPLVLSCEHARADLPPDLDLGLAPEVLRDHVAWDAYAFEVAARLALDTGAPLVAGQLSRLVVDLNRHEDGAEVVPSRAFGVEVPGNAALDADARARRIQAFHAPYRRSLLAEVTRAAQVGPCVHLSVHSFSATLDPAGRDFDLGLLFDPARAGEVALVEAWLPALRAAGFDARPNAPYLGTDDGCTTWLRTRLPDARYAGVELELHQRLSADRRAHLVAALRALLAPA